jgi:hypothetical protein
MTSTGADVGRRRNGGEHERVALARTPTGAIRAGCW